MLRFPVLALIVFVGVLSCISFWLGVHRNGDADTHALAFREGEHAGWNRVSLPRSSDINLSENHFVAWWSPGHVLIPFALERMGLAPFRARALINIGCIAVGLVGVWCLVNALALDRWVGALACAGLVLSPTVSGWWLYYGGGDVLTFAFTPWVFRWALLRSASRASTLLGLGLVGVIGFFLKSSLLLLLILVGALLILLWWDRWLDESRSGPGRPPLWASAQVVALVMVIILVLKFSYLDFGDNPSRATFGGNAGEVVYFTPHPIKDVVYPLAGPVLALFPLELLAQRFGPAGDAISWIGAALTALIAVGYGWRSGSRRLALLLSVTVLGYAAFFALQYCRDASISWESRHFIPAAIPMSIAMAKWVGRFTRTSRWIAAGFFCLGWSYQFAVIGLHRFPVWRENTVIVEGDTLAKKSLPVWREIRRIDQLPHPRDRLFLILPWDRSLELGVQHSRLIPLSMGNTGMPSFRANGIRFPGSLFHGNGPDIYIVTDASVNIEQVLSCFPDYFQNEIIFEAADWKIHRALGQRTDAARVGG